MSFFQTSSSPTYTYESIKALSDSPKEGVIIIDAREKAELKDGTVPNSYSVPYLSHKDAYSYTDEKFKSTFGFDKPSKDTLIVFTCQSGRRAMMSDSAARANGYEKTAVYPGSWNEWSQKSNTRTIL